MNEWLRSSEAELLPTAIKMTRRNRHDAEPSGRIGVLDAADSDRRSLERLGRGNGAPSRRTARCAFLKSAEFSLYFR
jgi:hypothetical protein